MGENDDVVDDGVNPKVEAGDSDSLAGRAVRSSRAWIPVFVGALFVVGCAAVFSWVLRSQPDDSISRSDGTVAVAKDAFERSGSNGIGRATGGHSWITWSGGWSISAGVAHVAEPSARGSYAVIEAGPDASISATVGGNAGCGLIAAASSSTRSVQLVEVPLKQRFELRVVNGEVSTVVETIPAPKRLNSLLSLRIEDGVVAAAVGADHVSAVLADDPHGTFAGLFATGTGQARCTFDDVVVFHPGN